MLSTYDRYLLRRFFWVFTVFWVSLYGLFVVIDCFTNLDAFQENSRSVTELVSKMGLYYAFRACEFFELTGPILSVVAVIVVMALLQKNGEIHPILAAGIPTFRLAVPLVIGVLIVSGLLMANQEFVIPQISHRLQAPRGDVESAGKRVEPLYDYDRQGRPLMHISGQRVQVELQTMYEASFTLRPPVLSNQLMSIKAAEAVFYPPNPKRAISGWLLKGVSKEVRLDTLTDKGRQLIVPQKNSDDLFIVSRVSFDQLYNRTRNQSMMSTSQLIDRIRYPSAGLAPVRGQQLNLHFRFTRPLLALAMVLGVVPLVARRESRSLIGNLAICSIVMFAMYATGQACLYLGSSHILATDLAAWLPVIIAGGLSAFVSGFVQT